MRPTERPKKPYTDVEIIERVLAHFETEGNPRCVVGPVCKYNLTGCAVGCLLTKEDAEILAEANPPVRNLFVIREYAEIWNAYFIFRQKELLVDLQYLHDDANYSDFAVEFPKAVRRLAERHNIPIKERP